MDNVGNEDYIKEEYFNNRNILVGLLKNKGQLEKNLNHKFYHIPCKGIDLVKNKVEYIAIYQSKKDFGENVGILYCGKIKDIKFMKKKDITFIPSNK